MLRTGRSLRDTPSNDLVDITFSLFAEWSCMEHAQVKQMESINRYFRDKETEAETGIPVLPGWASIGNVAAQYGDVPDDPLAAEIPEDWPPAP